MTKKYIDGLIKKAGLKEIVSIYNSAIEINTHLVWPEKPIGTSYDECGYQVLAGIIQAALDDKS